LRGECDDAVHPILVSDGRSLQQIFLIAFAMCHVAMRSLGAARSASRTSVGALGSPNVITTTGVQHITDADGTMVFADAPIVTPDNAPVLSQYSPSDPVATHTVCGVVSLTGSLVVPQWLCVSRATGNDDTEPDDRQLTRRLP
jgi:hypothetical protein